MVTSLQAELEMWVVFPSPIRFQPVIFHLCFVLFPEVECVSQNLQLSQWLLWASAWMALRQQHLFSSQGFWS